MVSNRSIKKGMLLAGFLMIFSWLVIYFAKAVLFYQFLKQAPAHYSLGLFESDKNLGYRLLANHRGYYFLSATDSVPVCTDSNRRRVSCNKSTPAASRKTVFLGDSFTFGEACEAESTFVVKVSDACDLQAINLGTGGYGLAQMQQLLHQFIRTGHKNFVVQLSPWLANRATTGYLDSKLIKVPVPALDLSEQGELKVISPAYLSILFELGNNGVIRKIRKTNSGFFDFLGYLFQCGIPLYSREAVGELTQVFRESSNSNPEELESAFLNHLNYLAQKDSCSIQLLLIGYNENEAQEKEKKLHSYPHLQITNASSVLYSELPEATDSLYEKTYMHWSRDGKNILDRHPNSAAHSIIANQIKLKSSCN